MAKYSVGEGGDFTTLAAAAKAAKPGDVFDLLTGTFNELFECRVPDVTWRASEGQQPVIDAGWNGKEVEGYVNAVNIVADGVGIYGVKVVNSPGRGIAISSSGVTVSGCSFFNCYHGGLVANGTKEGYIRNLRIENNRFEKLSQSWITEKNPKNVAGSFIFVRVRESVVVGNVITDGYGEGLNIDRDTDGCVYMLNAVISTNHAGCYFCRSTNNVVTNCVFIHRLEKEYQGASGNWPAAVVFGDETASASFGPQSGNEFRENVVVSWGRLLEVRNGKNYDTRLTGTKILSNTFVSGPKTTYGIQVAKHDKGPHDVEFADNVVWFDNAVAGSPIAGEANGFRCEGNAWSVEPPPSMRSGSDIYGDLMLANPAAPVAPTFDVDNYRPLPDSPLVSEDYYYGALEPVEIAEPEPPPNGGDPLLKTKLNALRQQLSGISDEMEIAIAAVDGIIDSL